MRRFREAKKFDILVKMGKLGFSRHEIRYAADNSTFNLTENTSIENLVEKIYHGGTYTGEKS